MRKYMQNNADNIINRRPFKENSISGKLEDNVYKIYSYTTPIAFYSPGSETWYITTKRYNQTTIMQQQALRLILNNEHVVASTPEMFALRIRALQGLPRPTTT